MRPPLEIRIHNIRLGFATNSSGSHSLIYLPGLTDDLSRLAPGRYEDEPFVLASPEAKLPYVQLQLREAGVLEGLVLSEFGATEDDAYLESWSSWSAPESMLLEIARWVMKQGVAVLGGEGNASRHPLSDRTAIDPSHYGHLSVRRDPLGFWTVFNSGYGAKLRLSFHRAGDPHVQPFRATWPELVDVKITDHCTQGCAWCYQDSKPGGRHAALSDLLALVPALQTAKVFEVVLGGGEPTQHPEFCAIVRALQQAGIQTAFTTRDLGWISRRKGSQVAWDEVAWAVSVDDVEGVRAAYKAARGKVRYPAIHIVMGSPASEPERLLAILSECERKHLRAVLLGYKRTGRGATFQPQLADHWLHLASGVHWLAIDTVLASQYASELRRHGVPDWQYDTEDGRFSMYIDTVRGLCGPSSYSDEGELFPLPTGDDAIEKAFADINERLGPARRLRELERAQAEAANDPERLVLLDAAMEGRCEACGCDRASEASDGFFRPKVLCDRCRVRRSLLGMLVARADRRTW